MLKTWKFLIIGLLVLSGLIVHSPANGDPLVRFQKENSTMRISIGGDYFGSYVYQDDKILRPYFCDLHAPGGIRVTRNHPPVEGVDRTDHDEMHPGLWMAFGDINGSDFWRNKARVKFLRFIREPQDDEVGAFSVENQYLASDGIEQCREICEIKIQPYMDGRLISWRSQFFSEMHDVYFGDQEEMGLGVRVHTPMAADHGGRILNSLGQINEKEAWGKQAEWCDYSGQVDGKWAGVTLIPSPHNFRTCWFHARDYGFVAANPFGRNAFTKGEKSKVLVKKGERFELVYLVFIHCGDQKDDIDLSAVYEKLRTVFDD
ncbi:MAG: PmoA family protein [Candidatus Omnitrophica bacterium]|nr:PmoA family protein [Candidatus Omnitrophota bacterium]